MASVVNLSKLIMINCCTATWGQEQNLTVGVEAEQRDPWLDVDDLWCNVDAMHGIYKNHSCDETVVQATARGVAILQMHPNEALQVGNIEGDRDG